jgi:hypothetical protein
MMGSRDRRQELTLSKKKETKTPILPSGRGRREKEKSKKSSLMILLRAMNG